MTEGSAAAAFAARYGASPTHEVVAPGRVNLIGEHIDYCGLSVLPMAIGRRVRLLLRPRRDAEARFATTAPREGERRFRLSEPIEAYEAGDWGNYPKAAARALLGRGPLAGHIPRGLDALVTSDLPVAAGLSSSSALVVACALGLLTVNGRGPGDSEPHRLELAERLARGERFVGTAGGGMDQAVCLLGRAGHALRIEFEPLRTSPVAVPPEWAFVVAHSGERAEKSGRAREVYNARTRECAAALEGVRRRLGADPEGGRPAGYRALSVRFGADRLLDAAEGALGPPLRARFRHVVSEARRVAQAEAALRAADLPRFGALLSASHASLRDDYEVSTPALDRLVEVAQEAGAAGARLTGAGLGGCIVALCPAADVAELREALRARFPVGGVRGKPPGPAAFEVRPSDGAVVRRL